MHLSSRTDIEAPLTFVFSALTDFDGWERSALRRGAEVNRIDKPRVVGVGMAWSVKFRMRGKDRKLEVKVTTLEPDTKLGFFCHSRVVDGDMSFELMSLSPKRTRLVFHSQVQPLTLGARLFMQSVKLAKARVQTRLNQRLQQLGSEIEQRFATQAKR